MFKWLKKIFGLDSEDTVPVFRDEVGIFRIYTDKAGMFRWHIKDSKGRIRATGHQPFRTIEQATNDIDFLKDVAFDAEIIYDPNLEN